MGKNTNLLFENKHVAVVGLAAQPQALLPRPQIYLVQILSPHVLRILRPDDLVPVYVEVVYAGLQVDVGASHSDVPQENAAADA